MIWQERVTPLVVVELLYPGTEKEDLGQTLREAGQPPTKWEVYEQFLKAPYYFVFDRYTNNLRAFQLNGSRYQEVVVPTSGLPIPELELTLGLWQGEYKGVSRLWLRWFDDPGRPIPISDELLEQERLEKELAQQQAERERQRAELADQRAEEECHRAELADQRAEEERQRAERLAAKLRELNLDPDSF